MAATLVLRNDRSELQALSDWIDSRIETLGLDAELAYAVRLCLEEAVVNVIMHGASDAGHALSIDVHLDRGSRGWTATVEDQGLPFDPLAHCATAGASSLQEMPVGGLGIRLMRSYASAMQYSRSEGVNRLTMTFESNCAQG